ncbi:MAG: ABC transporter substrate-binding protein [Planctomycetota bacterium]
MLQSLIMKIRAFVCILILGVLAAMGGAASGGRPVTRPVPEEVPARGDQIVIAMLEQPKTLLGPFASSDSETNIASLVFPTLMNLKFNKELEHVPGLAEKYERAADGKTITFYLKDAQWDDGKPIVASDFVFTYKLIANPDFESDKREYLERIESVEAVDAKTIRFKYKNSYYPDNQISDANVGVLPEHIYKNLTPAEARGSERAFMPVGHGRFRVASHDGNKLFVLERNPNSKVDNVAYLKRVIFYYTSASPEAAKNHLLAGDVDAIDTSRVDDAELILSKGGYTGVVRGLRSIDFVAWNIKNPLFADREIRRALTLAINRGGINSDVFNSKQPGVCAEPVGTIPPAMETAIVKDLKPLPFDRLEAARIFDRKGWKLGAGGIREKDGKKFTFKLSVNTDTPRRAQTANMIQQDLRAVGIDVQIDGMAFAALRPRAAAREYDAIIYGFQASLQLKQGEVWNTGAAHNYSNYSSAEVDEIISKVGDENDVTKLRELLKRLQRIVYEDQPVTFLCWYSRITLHRDRYRNFGATVLSSSGDIAGCYVPKALQKMFIGE